MAEILSFEEMKKRYYGEWLLIAYTEVDEDMNVLKGEVLAHSSDRDTAVFGQIGDNKALQK